MTISKSLPIQFWLTSEYTYNEDEICGVNSDCFCEHVNYDEYITIQFNHNAALTLKVYDSSTDVQKNSQAMTLVDTNTYQLKLKPNVFVNDNNLKNVYFKVFAGATELARTGCVIIGGCLTFPTTSTTTTTTTLAPTTTTAAPTTTTTTLAPTTTTTTPAPTTTTTTVLCELWQNQTASDLTGINYISCLGIGLSDQTVAQLDGVCVQPDSLSGGDSALLTFIGNC